MCANRANQGSNLLFFFDIVGDLLIKYLNLNDSEEVPSVVLALLAAWKLAQGTSVSLSNAKKRG
jgi:hypothetical protein